MKYLCTGLILFFIISTEICWGVQQIETIVFPSEDEIVEALILGEISIEQFYILTEIISTGVIQSSFLLDEIPTSLFRVDTTISQNNQTKYFITSVNKKSAFVTIQNRYTSYLNENASTRMQSSVRFDKDDFDFNIILRKEFSGRERFVRRSIAFKPVGNSYSLIVGNFSKRFGLGGVIGYRGKLLSYSDEIDSESLLFPDYGGFNGLYVLKTFDNDTLETVFSYNRDEDFSVFTNSFMYTHEKFPSVIISLNEIKNRMNNKKFSDLKTSFYKRYKYKSGEISTELVTEFNKKNNSIAFLIDGKHKTIKQYIKYSFWKYGKAFVDISGGSKTSLISEKVYLDTDSVNYMVSSKRSDQIGGLLKQKISLSHQWNIDVASLYSFKNSDTTELQFYGEVLRKIKSKKSLSIDFLFRRKVRNTDNLSTPFDKTQYRLLFIYAPEKLYVRTYLSYIDKTEELSYSGIFSELKYRSNNFGLIHLWLNINRLNYHTNQLDYFYGFLKNQINLYNSLSLSFKISHRYNRLTTDKYQNQFSIDVKWKL